MARKQRRNPGTNQPAFDLNAPWAAPEEETNEQIRNNAQGPVDAG